MVKLGRRRGRNHARSVGAVGLLRQAPRARRRGAQRGRRRDRGHAGRQRCRQVLLPEGAGRHGRAHAGRRHQAGRSRPLRLARARHRRGGPGAGAGGSRPVRRAQRAREPAARRLPSACAGARDGEPRPRVRAVSATGGAHGPACADHERWRAADAGRGPGPHVATADPAARRALARAFAADVQGAVRHARPRQGAGRGRAAGRAERDAEPGRRQPRLSAGQRAYRRRRRGGRSAERPGCAPRLSRRRRRICQRPRDAQRCRIAADCAARHFRAAPRAGEMAPRRRPGRPCRALPPQGRQQPTANEVQGANRCFTSTC